VSSHQGQRLEQLEAHLAREHPYLKQAVAGFKDLDHVAHDMALLDIDESYAARVPWWPLIAVLGTFSAGKSTFVNHILGQPLQRTGSQAVDDKFTVICYSSDGEIHTLPGQALDADPRFPFYGISAEIEKVESGEGRRVDAYLQLKTCPAETLSGKILIDSPGFDADDQRDAILRITDHIIDRSDLVLVLFDAHRPEPGAMRDTLTHLVGDSVVRPDSGKFLYILNQVDTAAREDNVEDVVAAWQHALAQKGLMAGRFYRIYTPEAAVPIEDEEIRRRYERKRNEDMAEIAQRIKQVEIERTYRLIGHMQQLAQDIEQGYVPALKASLAQWRRMVWWLDGAVLGGIVVLLVIWTLAQGEWSGLSFTPPPLIGAVMSSAFLAGIVSTVAVSVLVVWHFTARGLARDRILAGLQKQDERPEAERNALVQAFGRSVRLIRPMFIVEPAGWGYFAQKRLAKVRRLADDMVRILNDHFARPSGEADGRDHEKNPVD